MEDYSLRKLIITTVKDHVLDIIRDGVDMLLYGKPRHGREKYEKYAGVGNRRILVIGKGVIYNARL